MTLAVTFPSPLYLNKASILVVTVTRKVAPPTPKPKGSIQVLTRKVAAATPKPTHAHRHDSPPEEVEQGFEEVEQGFDSHSSTLHPAALQVGLQALQVSLFLFPAPPTHPSLPPCLPLPVPVPPRLSVDCEWDCMHCGGCRLRGSGRQGSMVQVATMPMPMSPHPPQPRMKLMKIKCWASTIRSGRPHQRGLVQRALLLLRHPPPSPQVHTHIHACKPLLFLRRTPPRPEVQVWACQEAAEGRRWRG